MLQSHARPVLLTLTVLGGAALGGGFATQDPARQDPADKLVLEAGAHAGKDLVDKAARFLKRNYVYQESELSHDSVTVNLQNRLELDRDGCETVVGQLLYSLGFVLVPMDPERGIYEVINFQGPKRNEIMSRPTPMTPAEVMQNRQKKTVVQCTLELANINAQNATNMLRPLFSGGGGGGLIPGAVGGGNALALVGYADSVANAIDMVSKADIAAGGGEDAEEPPGPSVRVQLDEITARLRAVEKRLERLEAKR